MALITSLRFDASVVNRTEISPTPIPTFPTALSEVNYEYRVSKKRQLIILSHHIYFFTSLFIYSFIYLFLYSFIHLFVSSFVRSFERDREEPKSGGSRISKWGDAARVGAELKAV